MTTVKLERKRERLGVKFDVNELKEVNPKVTRKTVAETLGLSSPSIDNYQKGLWPLSCYKAVIEKFAPQLADSYELKLLVVETQGSFFVMPEALKLARLYDCKRGGRKITLASGKGYHIIPEGLTPFEEAMEHAASPTLTLMPDSAPEEPAAVAPVQNTENERERQLLEQQDGLIEILARVTLERNALSIERDRQQLKIREQDGVIKAQAERNRILKQSVKEWEELSGKADLMVDAHKFGGDAIADAVVQRLTGLLGNRKGPGQPDLRLELDKINPKRMGYRH